jgi:Cu-processing system permease protein
VNLVIMLAVYGAVLLMYKAPLHGALLQAIELIFVELLLVTAIAMFFSTFSTATLSAIMTLSLYIIGHLSTDLKGLAQRSQSEMVKAVMTSIYYLCPNLEVLNTKGQAAMGMSATMSYQVLASLYGLSYTALLLTAACIIFQRRDF